jgi:hypothetical protein
MGRQLAGLGMFALGSVLAWSGCGGQSAEPSPSVKGSRDMPTTSAMWNAMAEDEANEREQVLARQRLRRAFRFARSPAESLPRAAERHLRITLGAPPGGFALADAQQINSPSGSIWVVHGQGDARDAMCLLQGIQGYAGCTVVSDFARRGLSIGMAKPSEKDGDPPQDFRVLGVVPDWVEVVQVSIGSRAMRDVPVRGAVYTLRADAPIFLERFCTQDQETCRSARPEAPSKK